jgi:acyl carrier protein
MTKSLNLLQIEISKLIVDSLNLEDVDPTSLDQQAQLFGDGLGLDSIDALEIGAAISRRYDIKIKSQNKDTEQHFSSIESLAKFVQYAIGSRVDTSGG